MSLYYDSERLVKRFTHNNRAIDVKHAVRGMQSTCGNDYISKDMKSVAISTTRQKNANTITVCIREVDKILSEIPHALFICFWQRASLQK